MPIKLCCLPLELTSHKPFVQRSGKADTAPAEESARGSTPLSTRQGTAATGQAALGPRTSSIGSRTSASRHLPGNVQTHSAGASSHIGASAAANLQAKKKFNWAHADTTKLSKDKPAAPNVTAFLDEFGKTALKTGSMMEVGFEDGSGVRAFLERGWTNLNAVDVNKACGKFIEDEVGSGKAAVQYGKIQDVTIPSNLDVINTHFVLSFLEEPVEGTVKRYLDEGLRPGGFLIGSAMGDQFKPGKGSWWEGREGLATFNESAFQKMLQDLGYVDVEVRPKLVPHKRTKGAKPSSCGINLTFGPGSRSCPTRSRYRLTPRRSQLKRCLMPIDRLAER